ncbi:hypothetical protein LCS81_24575 [Vibrio harveyi]
MAAQRQLRQIRMPLQLKKDYKSYAVQQETELETLYDSAVIWFCGSLTEFMKESSITKFEFLAQLQSPYGHLTNVRLSEYVMREMDKIEGVVSQPTFIYTALYRYAKQHIS